MDTVILTSYTKQPVLKYSHFDCIEPSVRETKGVSDHLLTKRTGEWTSWFMQSYTLLCRHLCCDSLQTQMEWMASVFLAQVRYLLPVVRESIMTVYGKWRWFSSNVRVLCIYSHLLMSIFLIYKHPDLFLALWKRASSLQRGFLPAQQLPSLGEVCFFKMAG